MYFFKFVTKLKIWPYHYNVIPVGQHIYVLVISSFFLTVFAHFTTEENNIASFADSPVSVPIHEPLSLSV